MRNGLTWKHRRDAWLANVDRAKAARLLRETEEARERWRANGRELQNIGGRQIATIDPVKLDPGEARRFLVDGASLESRGLGLDNRAPAVQVTNQTANLVIDPRALENATKILLERRQRILLEQVNKEQDECTTSIVTEQT